jgi:hypothetical protein
VSLKGPIRDGMAHPSLSGHVRTVEAAGRLTQPVIPGVYSRRERNNGGSNSLMRFFPPIWSGLWDQ